MQRDETGYARMHQDVPGSRTRHPDGPGGEGGKVPLPLQELHTHFTKITKAKAPFSKTVGTFAQHCSKFIYKVFKIWTKYVKEIFSSHKQRAACGALSFESK